MTARTQPEELRRLLLAIPKQALVDAVVEYACSDDSFSRYFMAIARMSGVGSQEEALKEVLENIDSTFGDDDLPMMMEYGHQAEFDRVQELIEKMLKQGMYDAVIQAAERCFELQENPAQVQEPDDFLGECYEPIISAWIKALHGSQLPASSIAQQVLYLQNSDRFGAFYGLKKRFSTELGEDVLSEMSAKVRN